MTFTEVKELPRTRKRKRLKYIFEDFMSLRVKIAKVDFDEHDYKDIKNAYKTLYHSCKIYGFPINVRFINDEVYFERRDM